MMSKGVHWRLLESPMSAFFIVNTGFPADGNKEQTMTKYIFVTGGVVSGLGK